MQWCSSLQPSLPWRRKLYSSHGARNPGKKNVPMSYNRTRQWFGPVTSGKIYSSQEMQTNKKYVWHLQVVLISGGLIIIRSWSWFAFDVLITTGLFMIISRSGCWLLWSAQWNKISKDVNLVRITEDGRGLLCSERRGIARFGRVRPK